VSTQPKGIGKASKRRRRFNVQRIVIWAIIVLFSLSIVGGIVVIGASIGR
jgi:hypothetical protein